MRLSDTSQELWQIFTAGLRNPAAERSHWGTKAQSHNNGRTLEMWLPISWLAQVMAQDGQTCAHRMVAPANIPGKCRRGAHRIPLCLEHSQVAPLHLHACKGWMLGWEERRHNLLQQAPCSLKPSCTHWALHWAAKEREDGGIPLSPVSQLHTALWWLVIPMTVQEACKHGILCQTHIIRLGSGKQRWYNGPIYLAGSMFLLRDMQGGKGLRGASQLSLGNS